MEQNIMVALSLCDLDLDPRPTISYPEKYE